MTEKPSYILGINAYDHDTSACLLRDGEIAFAIAKERINRQKHATGFYRIAVDYCLNAEGITLDDVELVVRNCYIMPVEEMDRRLANHDMPATSARRSASRPRPIRSISRPPTRSSRFRITWRTPTARLRPAHSTKAR
jgi:carbamoyltransferase